MAQIKRRFPNSQSPDQREFRRIKMNTPISLYYGNPEQVREAMCVDISDKGMGISIDTIIPMGTECYVRIHDGRNSLSRFQAQIEITRLHGTKSGLFRLGAVILEKY